MMLLDTNVISEIVRQQPDPRVYAWFGSLPKGRFWTSSVVMAELLSGVALMPAGRRKNELEESLEDLIGQAFEGRILDFDLPAARCYAGILSTRRKMGRPIAEMDAQIAAIAKTHEATLVTRNVNDFADCGVGVVNPWQIECDPAMK